MSSESFLKEATVYGNLRNKDVLDGSILANAIFDRNVTIIGNLTTSTINGNVNLTGNSTATTQSTGDSSTAIATTAFVKNQGYLSGTGTVFNSGITINETTGSQGDPNTGTILIKHSNAGGASSIVFRSAANAGSDYGYIRYQDAANIGGGGESAKLTIGTSNDADDDIYISPSGRTYFTGTNVNFNLNTFFNEWIRCNTSNTGIYWEQWGGGWNMIDSTFMRCYNDKVVYTGTRFHQGQLGGGFTVTTNWNNSYLSNMKFAESYIEMTRYNTDFTSVMQAIGWNIFGSDLRKKKNIKEPDITDVCALIKQIRFVSFDWIEESMGHCDVGFIAQELELIHPNFVNNHSDVDTFGDGIGSKSINTNTLSTFNVKATAELITRVETLEEENKQLKQDLLQIRGEMAELRALIQK